MQRRVTIRKTRFRSGRCHAVRRRQCEARNASFLSSRCASSGASMSRPLELLREAAHDDWSDPVETARRATEGLLQLVDQDWEGTGLHAARTLRERRPDLPLVLAVTERSLDPDSDRVRAGLQMALAQLEDETWSSDLGLRNAHHDSLGVTSLGRSTLSLLEAASQLGSSRAQLFTDRRAVSKGLGYLNFPISVAPPAWRRRRWAPQSTRLRSTRRRQWSEKSPAGSRTRS